MGKIETTAGDVGEVMERLGLPRDTPVEVTIKLTDEEKIAALDAEGAGTFANDLLALSVAARNRDLAALGRQGFDFDTARRVIDADDLEDLEQAAAAPPG